jgi:hypothetical protein
MSLSRLEGTSKLPDMQSKSPYIGRFVCQAERAGLSEKTTREFLRDIDVHPFLLGLVRRLRNLKNMLAFEQAGQRLLDVHPNPESWLQVIEWVLDDPQRLAREMELPSDVAEDFLVDSKQDPLMQQGVKRHGLQALLWHGSSHPPEDPCTSRFTVLQGQMLLAHVSIVNYEYMLSSTIGATQPDDSVFESLYSPAKFARFFARTAWSDSLRLLPVAVERQNYFIQLESLCAEVKGSLVKRSKDDLRHWTHVVEALTSIAGFLRRGLAPADYLKKRYERDSNDVGGRSGTDEPELELVQIGDPDDSAVPGVEASIVRRWIGTRSDRQSLIDAGEDPADFLLRRKLVLVSPKAGVADNIAAALERANQTLSWSFDEQTPSEYLRLIRAMQADTNTFRRKRDALEMIAWMDTIFWASCSPEQATNLMVGTSFAPAADCDLFLCLGTQDDDDDRLPPSFRLRAIEPDYLTVEQRVPGQERTRVFNFEIPDLGGVSNNVSVLLDYLRSHSHGDEVTVGSFDKMPIKLFTHTTAWFRKTLKAFVETTLDEGDRITISRLRKTMFQRLLEAPRGDIVSAALLTCNKHALASVRLSYSTFAIEHLRRVHRFAMEGIIAELQPAGWISPSWSHDAVHADDNSAGSRSCILLESLSNKVQKLQGIVVRDCALRSVRDRQNEFELRHQACTLLVVWLVGISVGMRGILNPSIHSSEYDPITRIGALTDKDPGDGRKSRLFRLPKLVDQSIRNYEAYLLRLGRLGLPPATRKQPCYFVRFVEGNAEVVLVGPSSIKKMCGAFFPFPANFARRLVRTEAIERGVPPAFVDAYCGHAFRGEESFNAYSSFDPLLYFDEMEEAIDFVLDELGFEVMTVEPLL